MITNEITGLNDLDLAPLTRKIFDTVYDVQKYSRDEAMRRVDAVLLSILKYYVTYDFTNGYAYFPTEIAATPNDLKLALTALHLTPYLNAGGVTAVQTAGIVGVPGTSTPTEQQAAAAFVKGNIAGYVIPGIDINDARDHIISYLYFPLGSNFLKLVSYVG